MSPVPLDEALTETASPARRFGDLRGLRWRIDLGILPSSPSATVDDLRRVTADFRRRYAALRRQLLVDPHVPKDGSNSPDLMDNPLSQNPDSMWDRFFRNAELERMVDQDLSRLYPEHGSYFQTPGCQGMLRRILLIWCLTHPEYGYRQGMHEVLAPLLYVLHVDVECLLEVRRVYEEYFTDIFDGFSFHENDSTYKFDFKKFAESMEDGNGLERSTAKTCCPSDLDPKIQTVVLISDAYGAEGELGMLLSEKFMEHDAYCMFDALMNGAGGAVAMAEFYSSSPLCSSHGGLTPVLEASATLYHLLSIADSSVHSHLVALGVEPQYFALRWLRVLFGREFALEDLLLIWDEIFTCDNSKSGKSTENDAVTSCAVLDSSRGAFISAFSVSMILYLRSLLLATENATSCLQKLLNFPQDIDLGKLVKKAKSLQALAMDASNSTPLPTHAGLCDGVPRGRGLSLGSTSPRTPLSLVPDSYWEERWRVLHREEERKQGVVEKQVLNRRKSWSEKVRLRLFRTESDPSLSESTVDDGEKNPNSSVRRSLLQDLAQPLGSDEDTEKIMCGEDLGQKDRAEANGPDGNVNTLACTPGQRYSSYNAASEENSSVFSYTPSPPSGTSFHDIGSERSSVASNSSVIQNNTDAIKADLSGTSPEGSSLPVSKFPKDISLMTVKKDDSVGKTVSGMKERKLLSGKLQWLWKFGRHPGEGTSEKGGTSGAEKPCNGVTGQSILFDSSISDACEVTSGTINGETFDQNLMLTLRNLGQSMLENIQVIESVLQQDKDETEGPLEKFSKNNIVGREQVRAVAALEELWKISNLLSEMGVNDPTDTKCVF